MPVASETSRIQYAGNGSTVVLYGVPFYFLANGDIRVVLADGNGVETLLVENSHYTLTGAGNPSGGNVTTEVAYDGTHTLTIYREPQQTQSADFQSTGALPADTLTRGLDKLTMLVQSLTRKVSRCFRLNDKAGDVAALSEATRANTVFGFDSAGGPALRDQVALLSMLSLSGSLQGAPTAYWADDGERVLKVPDFVGQLGLQLDTSALYRSTGSGAGSWTPFAITNFSGSISNLPGTLTLAKFADGIITYAKLQHVNGTQRLLGRNTSGAGAMEEITLSQLLDWVGSASQWDVLVRGASGWSRQPLGVLQTVWDHDTNAYTTTTTTPAMDTSIPQNTEGSAITNLSVTITPRSATSFLIVECVLNVGLTTAGRVTIALFRDSGANAIAATAKSVPSSSDVESVVIMCRVASSATNPTTFSLRFGTSSGIGVVNGNGLVTPTLGGTLISSMKVTELQT